MYTYRIKVISAESFHLTDKQIIEEVNTLKELIYIFPREFRPFTLLYAFYSNNEPENSKIQMKNSKNNIYINDSATVFIYPTCEKFDSIKKGELVLLQPMACSYKQGKVIKTYTTQDRSGEILYNLIRK